MKVSVTLGTEGNIGNGGNRDKEISTLLMHILGYHGTQVVKDRAMMVKEGIIAIHVC